MTATTVQSGMIRRSTPRLRGLAWITWRQHRVAFAGAVALLGGFALLMLINGLAMHADYSRLGLDRCGGVNSQSCQVPLDIFQQHYQGIAQFLPRVLAFLPGVLGFFVGAPLVARELESGTFRFAWTQGRNRVAWLVWKLLLLGVALTLLAVAFSAVFTWWFRPWETIMGRMSSGQAYEVEGVVFAARTLFGFMLGALLGTVIRRTVPAMAATAAVWVGIVWSSTVYLRPLIQAPVVSPAKSAGVEAAWTIDDWIQDASGRHVSSGELGRQILGAGVRRDDLPAWMSSHHYTEWVKYQPGSRFWHFQLIESASYLVLALLLAAGTIWWLRRRVV